MSLVIVRAEAARPTNRGAGGAISSYSAAELTSWFSPPDWQRGKRIEMRSRRNGPCGTASRFRVFGPRAAGESAGCPSSRTWNSRSSSALCDTGVPTCCASSQKARSCCSAVSCSIGKPLIMAAPDPHSKASCTRASSGAMPGSGAVAGVRRSAADGNLRAAIVSSNSRLCSGENFHCQSSALQQFSASPHGVSIGLWDRLAHRSDARKEAEWQATKRNVWRFKLTAARSLARG